MANSNSILSVLLRWLPRSLLIKQLAIRLSSQASKSLVIAVLPVLSSSLACRRLVSLSNWNWNKLILAQQRITPHKLELSGATETIKIFV